eukprot:m.194475 g.194475  ORF g.194475 m.194475 type:complete len:55 (+) comp10075_c2_seq2:663-827(+)
MKHDQHGSISCITGIFYSLPIRALFQPFMSSSVVTSLEMLRIMTRNCTLQQLIN